MPLKSPSSPITHFLCIPLVTPRSRTQLHKSFDTFRAGINDELWPKYHRGIPKKAIRPTETLHFTLGIMSLETPERVEGALALLSSLDIPSLLSPSSPQIAAATTGQSGKSPKTYEDSVPEHDNDPLQITLVGLHAMGDPAETSVLYAAPSLPSGKLYAFCNRLKDAFAEFLVPDNRVLLLHATVVNTIYARHDKKDDKGRRACGYIKKINAMWLLSRYWDFVWMEDVRLEKLAICRVGAREVENVKGQKTGDWKYDVAGEVPLPLT